MNVTDLLRKLEPLISEDVRNWRKSLPLLDSETQRLLEQHIVATAQRLLGNWDQKLLLSPPPRKKIRGAISLGTVMYDAPLYSFGLSQSELLQGLGIYGRSGAGKTNVVFQLIKQLERLAIPFLFLDWKRTARQMLPSLGRAVNFYTPGRDLSPFMFNPLIPPPGLEEKVHITQLIDLLSSAYTLGDGAKSLLEKVIHQAFEASDSWPTLASVLNILENTELSGRAAGWKATALRALQSLTFVDLLDQGEGDQAELVKHLLDESTVIELDGLNDNAKKFLVPVLMLWLFQYRLQAPDREQLRLVVIIEEAHHLLHRNRSESEMEKFLRQCRELGIGTVVVDQHPHLISSAALGNTYTSICLNLKEPTDISRASAMSLLGEDEKRYLTMLPVGHGVVKLQDRWHQPFLVRFSKVDVRKGLVTDQVLSRHLRNGRARFGRSWSFPSPPPVRSVGVLDHRVSTDGFRLLADCAAFPSDGVRVRYQRLGFSMDKGNRLKNRLLDIGLASGAEIPIGKTRRLVLRPTRYASEVLRLDANPTAESIEHEFWKRFYFERFREAGYRVRFEAPRVGGCVDVLANRGRERIGIEIETGKSDFLSNVQNGLKSGFSQIVVVATTEVARVTIEEQLSAKGLLIRGRVDVVLREGYGA